MAIKDTLWIIVCVIFVLFIVGSIIFNIGHTIGFDEGYDEIKNLYDDYEQINQNNLNTCHVLVDTQKGLIEICSSTLKECTSGIEFWYNSATECELLANKCLDVLKQGN